MTTMDNSGDDGDPIESHDAEASSRFDPASVPGVRVVIDPDPAVRAARLAEAFGGELLFDRETAEAAFAARAKAHRGADMLSDDEFDTLLKQASRLAPLRDHPTLDEETLSELRSLADAVVRTSGIRTRTELEFTDTLNRRLSASSGVAVHPEAIKQAALALTEAETEVNSIDQSITELGDRPRPEQLQLDSPDVVTEMFDDAGLEQQRRTRVFALSIGTIFAGISLMLLSVGVTAIVPIVLFLVGIVFAGAMVARSFGGDRHDSGRAEASALLAAATSNVERATEASARDRMAEDEWMARRSQLEAARERAVERARSARRHWDTLAGSDADPYDLDAVLRIHDPQFVITGAATKTSPTVRTVNAVHRKAMARWKIAWAQLGVDAPPAVDEFDESAFRVGDADERAAGDTEPEVHPMIFVEPSDWIDDRDLEALLATLPPGEEVVIVAR